MTINQLDTLITIVAFAIGVFAICFCAYHHYFIKPRQEERMKQLDEEFQKRILNLFNKEN